MDLGEVEKIWEEWEEGNNNQNLLYEKDLFSIKRIVLCGHFIMLI